MNSCSVKMVSLLAVTSVHSSGSTKLDLQTHRRVGVHTCIVRGTGALRTWHWLQVTLNIDSGRLHWAGGRTGFERPARVAPERATLPGVRSRHARHYLSKARNHAEKFGVLVVGV